MNNTWQLFIDLQSDNRAISLRAEEQFKAIMENGNEGARTTIVPPAGHSDWVEIPSYMDRSCAPGASTADGIPNIQDHHHNTVRATVGAHTPLKASQLTIETDGDYSDKQGSDLVWLMKEIREELTLSMATTIRAMDQGVTGLRIQMNTLLAQQQLIKEQFTHLAACTSPPEYSEDLDSEGADISGAQL